MFAVLIGMIACSRLFNVSPFGWIADKLFDLVASPLFNLWSMIFF